VKIISHDRPPMPRAAVRGRRPPNRIARSRPDRNVLVQRAPPGTGA
jgi:hypothetical protein